MKRLIAVRPETLVRLERLAAEVSALVDHRVEPLQVAALLIERELESLSDHELAEATAGEASRRPMPSRRSTVR